MPRATASLLLVLDIVAAEQLGSSRLLWHEFIASSKVSFANWLDSEASPKWSLQQLAIFARCRGLIIKILFWSHEKMRKQTIQYTSSLDALLAVAKRLSLYENQHKMDSEDFFHQYNQGMLSDNILFIEWANDYRHYLALRQEIELLLNYAT